MRLEVIVGLAKKHLDEMVTVYLSNEYIYGRWVEINTHTNTICIDVRNGNKRLVYMDMDCINAMEVET